MHVRRTFPTAAQSPQEGEARNGKTKRKSAKCNNTESSKVHENLRNGENQRRNFNGKMFMVLCWGGNVFVATMDMGAWVDY